jgi:predicted O-methyltransferase YrrM
MALVHCDEILQSGNMEKAKELSEKVKELYEVRQSNRNLLNVERIHASWNKTCPTRT